MMSEPVLACGAATLQGFGIAPHAGNDFVCLCDPPDCLAFRRSDSGTKPRPYFQHWRHRRHLHRVAGFAGQERSPGQARNSLQVLKDAGLDHCSCRESGCTAQMSDASLPCFSTDHSSVQYYWKCTLFFLPWLTQARLAAAIYRLGPAVPGLAVGFCIC